MTHLPRVVFRADPDPYYTTGSLCHQHKFRGDVYLDNVKVGRFSEGKAYSPAKIRLANGVLSPTFRFNPSVRTPNKLRRKMLVAWVVAQFNLN